MDLKIVAIHILLGLMTVCVGAPADGVESSTSTSVSVSTVTRKVSSRSFPRTYQPGNDTQPVTEDMLKVRDGDKPGREETTDGVAKPQKIKKKILASNLKNISEKVVFPAEKHEKVLPKSVVNVTETADGGKPNSEDSSEDEIAEDLSGKSENITEVFRTSNEGAKRNGGPIEGRSLEDRSSEENVNVNTKAKTKIPLSTTVRTTSSYSYETFGEIQKVLNNNLLNNNEGYHQNGARPSPSVVLPAKKSSPTSKENTLKNTIRFESDFFGPTGQTDWVPIIPDKLPVRSPAAGGPHFGSKLKPPIAEKLNKTNDRNSVVFPADGVQPAKEAEAERTTSRIRSSVQTSTSTERRNSTQPVRLVTKFRGAVRYKPSNSTVEEKFQNETVLKKNISLEVPAMGAPVTGASWTPASLDSQRKPSREETTEISVVSSTNHTTKSQNAVDGGLAVPPENVKIENVTKDPQTKNVIPPTTVVETKQNKSEATNSPPGIIDGGQGWVPLKMEKDGEVKNDTDLVVPESVPPSQRNESETETVRPSTVAMETTSEVETTEEMTESTPELTTLPKLFNATMETPTVSDASSQSEGDEVPMTVTTEEMVTVTLAIESFTPVVPTVLKTASADYTETETSTEFQPTTISDFVQNQNVTEAEPVAVVLSTQRAEEVETSPTAQSTVGVSPATFTTEAIPTSPKFILRENITGTTIPIETTNPKPNVTTTATTPSTVSTTETLLPSSPAISTAPPPKTSTVSFRYEETRTEPPEEGIYYKNYVPTTMNPHAEITEENVPAYLRLTVQAKGWEELCRLKEDLREAIIKMLGGKNVSADSVHFLNLNDRNCQEKIEETRGDEHNGTVFLPVNMFLMDKNGDFDKNLSEAFLTLWGRRGLDFELPIRKVDFVTPIVNLTELADPPLGGSVVAAIVISCVAGICVILLGVLFVIMKRRQKRFNYGQRCTPVSLDAYSLDSVSIYNSVRRKDVRASKRSYGNAAFDDPEVPTHPMNFAGLANFSSDKEQLYEEFNIIPQVYPKVEELPAGAETKNRYANIIPLPETRVHLSLKDGDPLSYYINANYVRGLKGAEKVYIACQAPMESTVEDFWRMIWEQQCKVILMVTDLQENGIEKSADYLPPNEVTDNLRLFGDFQVTLKKRDVKEKYIISNLKLKNMEANLWREVTHLWYLGWPDQGVPSEANSLIAFLIEARSQLKIQNGATTSSSIVVHCSPGTGRTGTVIACDLCIREYEQTRMVDIPRCVFNLRRDRAGAVQTKDQYAFIYQVLNVYATKLSGGGIESI